MKQRNSGTLPPYRDTFSKRDQGETKRRPETESFAAYPAGEALELATICYY